MKRRLVVDTGPIVALLRADDRDHAWAAEQVAPFDALYTCESVISEAFFLLSRYRGGADRLVELLEIPDHVVLGFDLRTERLAVTKLMRRYADVPMSLADACLVRMTELDPAAVVLTLDSDFRIYRRNGREVVPVILPPNR